MTWFWKAVMRSPKLSRIFASPRSSRSSAAAMSITAASTSRILSVATRAGVSPTETRLMLGEAPALADRDLRHRPIGQRAGIGHRHGAAAQLIERGDRIVGPHHQHQDGGRSGQGRHRLERRAFGREGERRAGRQRQIDAAGHQGLHHLGLGDEHEIEVEPVALMGSRAWRRNPPSSGRNPRPPWRRSAWWRRVPRSRRSRRSQTSRRRPATPPDASPSRPPLPWSCRPPRILVWSRDHQSLIPANCGAP